MRSPEAERIRERSSFVLPCPARPAMVSAELKPMSVKPDRASRGTGTPRGNWDTQIYNELRRMAAKRVARQAPAASLQATSLVHEAWLKLGGSHQHWQNRDHFFGAAANAMRQILIDQARRHAAAK